MYVHLSARDAHMPGCGDWSGCALIFRPAAIWPPEDASPAVPFARFDDGGNGMREAAGRQG
jgi:hypothetical protein